VSERSERAFWKTRKLAMKCAKWLQTVTSTTKLTHSCRLARSSRSSFIKNAPRFARCSWLKSGVYDFGSGKYEWLWVTTGGGFIIGLMRLIPIFPKSVDGLFREVRDLHVDPKSAPLIFISSCISLAVGASVGPEVSERRKEKRREACLVAIH